MMTHIKHLICALTATVAVTSVWATNPSRVEIDLKKRGAKIPSSLYGIFFEEITGSGDGGLYAEMVRNRGFEEAVVPSGCSIDSEGFAAAPHKCCYSNDSINRFRVRWNPDRDMTAWRVQLSDGSQVRSEVTDERPLNSATPHALKIDLSHARGEVSAINSGYWGIAVEATKSYDVEFYVNTDKTPWCRVAIVSPDGRILSHKDMHLIKDGKWNRYTASLIPSETGDKNTLQITFPAQGCVWLDYVSLFPQETYKGRANGLRNDVATMIEKLRPAFIRWPGGCIVEGLTMENRVKWKQTIGPAVERPGEYNLWGYRSTYGFGYHEFLQYCEDINSDAMFVCNAGMSCLFRNGDYVQGEELEPLIEEALDAIEYALGDSKTTKWGAERARNGHPEPFNLKYIEIGNENIFSRYAANYNRFYKAIKGKYPQLTIISALMFSKDVERLDKVEMIDPHYYETADWFYNNADVYDKLPKNLPYKVYVGEYAAVGRSDLYASLAEAAYLTGVERNADKIELVSYAPLIENSHYGLNHLMVLNNKQVYGRTNYHVMKLFAENQPDVNVATRIVGEQLNTPFSPKGFVGLSTGNTSAEFRDLKITTPKGELYTTDWSDFDSRWEAIRGKWSVENGVLRQPVVGGDALLRLKDLEVGDCTISLKARKLAGYEGFRVVFGLQDQRHYFMADMGSHSNESILFREIGDKGSVSLFDYRNQEPIEVNQWYDVRIEIRGNVWKCYMDNKLKYTYNYTIVNKHYAVAGLDLENNELVVKLVNGRSEPWNTTLLLNGGPTQSIEARKIELSSPSMSDENSFAEPEKIIGRESPIRIDGQSTTIQCAPNSLTILRIPVKTK